MMKVTTVLCLFSIAPVLLSTQARSARWHLVEDLRIGAQDGAQSLTQVSGILASPDGRTVYVAQPQESRIRVFDSRGRALPSIGRRGSGPGEFQGLAFLGWRGDTLCAVDATQYRISLFHPAGQHVQTLRVVSPDLDRARRPAVPVGMLADGTVLGRPPVPPALVISGEVTSIPLVRMDRQGQVVSTLAQLSRKNSMAAVPVARRMHIFTQPITANTLFALAPDGSSVVVVERPIPERGGPSHFSVSRIRPASGTVYSKSYRYTAQPLPKRIADSLFDTHVDVLTKAGVGRTQAERAVHTAIQIPGFQPPVAGVLVGTDGTTWIRKENLGSRTAEWLVLNPGGGIVATVSVPQSLQIMEIGRNAVWGVVHDDMDVPYVVRYRVRAAR
ncbi:MAG: hypothetical protein AB1941_23530 [Gemmatimonadota bacterium]